MSNLTASRVRQLLSYDAASGIFRWRANRTAFAKANTRAGSLQPRNAEKRYGGYRTIQIDGKRHQEHRVAWLYIHGHWPSANIDHINGDRSDNRLSNLRCATYSQNQGNISLLGRNTSGARGVTRHKKSGKWQAQITLHGRRVYLGLFDHVDDASAAYLRVAKRHFGEYLR